MKKYFKSRRTNEIYFEGKDQKNKNNLINMITGSEYFLPGSLDEETITDCFQEITKEAALKQIPLPYGKHIRDKKTAQQRQFEQVTMKLQSLLAAMEETVKMMPKKGDISNVCQRTELNICLLEVSYAINGITLEDFTPNEYSQDFKLSYS